MRLLLVCLVFSISYTSMLAQGPEMLIGEATYRTGVLHQVVRPDGRLLQLAHEFGEGVVLREFRSDGSLGAELSGIPCASRYPRIIVGTSGEVSVVSFRRVDIPVGAYVLVAAIADDLSSVLATRRDALPTSGLNSKWAISDMLFTRSAGYATVIRDSIWTILTYDYVDGGFESTEVFAQTGIALKPTFVAGDSVYYYSHAQTVCSRNGHSGNYFAYALDGSGFYPQVFRDGEVFATGASVAVNGVFEEVPVRRAFEVVISGVNALDIALPRRPAYRRSFDADIADVLDFAIVDPRASEVYLATTTDPGAPLQVVRLSSGQWVRDTIIVPPGFSATSTTNSKIVFDPTGRHYTFYLYQHGDDTPVINYRGSLRGAGRTLQPYTRYGQRADSNKEYARQVFWVADDRAIVIGDAAAYLVDTRSSVVLREVAMANAHSFPLYHTIRRLPYARQLTPGGDVFVPLEVEGAPEIGYYRIDASTGSLDSVTVALTSTVRRNSGSVCVTSQGDIGYLANVSRATYDLYLYRVGGGGRVSRLRGRRLHRGRELLHDDLPHRLTSRWRHRGRDDDYLPRRPVVYVRRFHRRG